MGLNAVTSVPTYTDGEILEASRLNVTNSGCPVFADATARAAAFGGTGEKVLAAGQLSYLESNNKIYVYNGTAWVSISSVNKVAAFTASGTWTVPAGVTYAVAHITGGGGGVGGTDVAGGAGGTSSVAFASGTVSATGGVSGVATRNFGQLFVAGTANSGQGAWGQNFRGADVGDSRVFRAQDGAEIVAGAAVTPAASITVTVGAGGTGTNGAAGGTGYVWIEYQE